MWKGHPIYAPMGYQPNSPKPDPETVIPQKVLRLAKESGGEFIYPDGKSIYRWRFNQLYVAYWISDYVGYFGAWELWTKEEIPTGVLREL